MKQLSVASWSLQTEHVLCVQPQREADHVRGCVCVILLIRQRRGQSFLVRGSKAALITHGWPFYLSHMSWIPDLITSLFPSPLYCFIAILLHTDHIRYLQGPANLLALLPLQYELKVCIEIVICFY